MVERRPAVLVVAYHAPDPLADCLAALERAFEIVVVDNSSDPDVCTVAKAHGARYVDSGANLGFSAGVNLGLSHIDSDADVLLLNPDAVLLAASVRSIHRDLLAGPGLAALTPRLTGPTGAQRAMWPFPSPGRLWREAFGLARLSPPPDQFAVGAVLMLRREAINAVGGFDERFFLYGEETDWQRRAASLGWRSGVSEVEAQHIGAGTSADSLNREVLFHAGTETYIKKWFGRNGWRSYRTAAIVGAALRSLIAPRNARIPARRRLSIYWRGPSRMARSES